MYNIMPQMLYAVGIPLYLVSDSCFKSNRNFIGTKHDLKILDKTPMCFATRGVPLSVVYARETKSDG